MPVAVKLFRDAATVTDGDPMHEIDLGSALQHPNVIQVLGALAKPKPGLVLELLSLKQPSDADTDAGAATGSWKELGLPPNFDTCTRDTYAEGTRFTLPAAISLLRGVAAACAHLHAKGFTHGDLYAHNTMIRQDGESKVGDFGAAFNYTPLGEAALPLVERIEARATPEP